MSEIFEKSGQMCVFCESMDTRIEPTRDRLYYRCTACGGIWMNPEDHLDGTRERERYLLHQNSLDNVGYRAYLEAFLDAIFEFPPISGNLSCKKWNVLDYGSGPCPSLSMVLRERGYEVRVWDPYFAPDMPIFRNGADLVTCLEVAEHFYEPRRDFSRLSLTVKTGGFLAVGTQCIPSTPFDLWWYRQDPTHTSFYTQDSLSLVAGYAGFEYLGKAADHVYIFRKRDGKS